MSFAYLLFRYFSSFPSVTGLCCRNRAKWTANRQTPTLGYPFHTFEKQPRSTHIPEGCEEECRHGEGRAIPVCLCIGVYENVCFSAAYQHLCPRRTSTFDWPRVKLLIYVWRQPEKTLQAAQFGFTQHKTWSWGIHFSNLLFKYPLMSHYETFTAVLPFHATSCDAC